MLSVRELKSFLQEVQAASLFDLSHRFASSPDLVRDRIQLLLRKGCVRKVCKTSDCGTKCVKCDPLFTEIYQWVDTH